MDMDKEQKENLEVVVDGALGATSGAALGAVSSGIAYGLTAGAVGLAIPILGLIGLSTLGGAIGIAAGLHNKHERKQKSAASTKPLVRGQA
jgi:hypothetical protein